VTVRLPLFPLGTVLFPGVLLPLHIFEDRYRQLVRDLLSAPEESRAFGVVANRAGREVGADGVQALYDVGCVARLRRVEPYEDGRFDLVSSGSSRFRLDAVDDAGPYLQADVELLGEPEGADAEASAALVTLAFEEYLEALGSEVEELPADPGAVSYLVAAAAVLDLRVKQALLEAPDATTRLRTELALLRRETELFAMLPSLPAVELTRVPASPN
jgi:Lon protease-like protein